MNVQPGPDALVNAQDKLVMRAAIDRLELPNPAWAAVADVAELVAFGDETGWPVVLKTPRGGYDGKGVRIVGSAEDAADTADWFDGHVPAAGRGQGGVQPRALGPGGPDPGR